MGGRIQEGKKRRSHTPIHRPTGQGRIELGARSTEHGTWSMEHGRGGESGYIGETLLLRDALQGQGRRARRLDRPSPTLSVADPPGPSNGGVGMGPARRRAPPSAGSTGPMWVCVGQRGNI